MKKYPPIIPGYPHMLHGGDYNPDQWLEYPGIVDQDFRLMKLAGCNTFSVGIFSWTAYEKSEGLFDFGWLDEIMDRMAAAGNKVFLATPSGAKPAWMAKKYPEICRVEGNANGIRDHYRSRHNHCWSAPIYRMKVQQIDRMLAQRYANHPALGGWHISNEYGGRCYCPLCQQNFREYLQRKYHTIEEFNRACWAPFWNHIYTSWDQIVVDDFCLDNLSLEWFHFHAWQISDFLTMEAKAIKEFSDAPVTTNMMGLCDIIDYHRVAECCDFIADDCYPGWTTVDDYACTAARVSMIHDLHRTMKHKPFVMMESCPSSVNWDTCSRLKRPGLHQAEGLLAVGHGADAVMYFQWRKGRGGGEKFHGAVVDHEGSENTRVFKDVAQVGDSLKRLQPVLGTCTDAKVAVVYDWSSYTALKLTAGPSDPSLKKTRETIILHHRTIWEQNIPTDVIESTEDFSRYDVIIAPMLFSLREGVAQRIKEFVKKGGIWVSTYLSSYVDQYNRVLLGGLPGDGLKEVFGIWQEEIDGLSPDDKLSILPKAGNPLGIANAAEVSDFAEILHLQGAEELATYSGQFYDGTPAITCNAYGKGYAYYIAGRTGLEMLRDFYRGLVKRHDIQTLMPFAPGMHATIRSGETPEEQFLFVYNFSEQPGTCTPGHQGTSLLDGTELPDMLTLPPFGVQVYRLKA